MTTTDLARYSRRILSIPMLLWVFQGYHSPPVSPRRLYSSPTREPVQEGSSLRNLQHLQIYDAHDRNWPVYIYTAAGLILVSAYQCYSAVHCSI